MIRDRSWILCLWPHETNKNVMLYWCWAGWKSLMESIHEKQMAAWAVTLTLACSMFSKERLKEKVRKATITLYVLTYNVISSSKNFYSREYKWHQDEYSVKCFLLSKKFTVYITLPSMLFQSVFDKLKIGKKWTDLVLDAVNSQPAPYGLIDECI